MAREVVREKGQGYGRAVGSVEKSRQSLVVLRVLLSYDHVPGTSQTSPHVSYIITRAFLLSTTKHWTEFLVKCSVVVPVPESEDS